MLMDDHLLNFTVTRFLIGNPLCETRPESQ